MYENKRLFSLKSLGILMYSTCSFIFVDAKPESSELTPQVSNSRGKFHYACYGRYCYVCKERKVYLLILFYIFHGVTINVNVTVFFQMKKYNHHPFWEERYCPAHDSDGTPKCFSCERLEVSRKTMVKWDAMR